jgi:hypothetical protein
VDDCDLIITRDAAGIPAPPDGHHSFTVVPRSA